MSPAELCQAAHRRPFLAVYFLVYVPVVVAWVLAVTVR